MRIEYTTLTNTRFYLEGKWEHSRVFFLGRRNVWYPCPFQREIIHRWTTETKEGNQGDWLKVNIATIWEGVV